MLLLFFALELEVVFLAIYGVEQPEEMQKIEHKSAEFQLEILSIKVLKESRKSKSTISETITSLSLND